ncbi:MAG TPA: BadF/BadG/BcrA/BcrD ATPase family protein [Symbiobacteriaceae bacterium]|nr:BadF/BadG/BcrA/BcrD ATPase family protein [Symbiobacteriaceae bacterium]
MPWVLGLDGGGTKTVALVANERGRVLGRGESGPANYHTAGLERAAEHIQQACSNAITDAGLVTQALSSACLALAGVDRTSDRQVMAGIVARLGLTCPVLLENDAAAALTGATGGRPGVVVVAGTGSIAFGEDEKGHRARAGGYGPLLGDEGSGYDIGRKGLIAALRAEDGRSPHTVLVERIKQRFMLESMTDMINLVYGNPAPLQRPEIAGLAPMVVEAAREGDSISREILRVAGRELGLCAAAVLQRLQWDSGAAVPVAGSGSVFAAGSLLALPMEQVIRSVCPRAEMTQPKHTAAYGSVLLALRGIGIHLEEAPGERN